MAVPSLWARLGAGVRTVACRAPSPAQSCMFAVQQAHTRTLATSTTTTTTTTVTPELQSFSVGERELTLQWDDGTTHCSFIWLKDHSPAVFHPVSCQRMIDTVALDPAEKPEDVRVQGDQLHITWPQGSQPKAEFSLAWLHANRYGDTDSSKGSKGSKGSAHAGLKEVASAGLVKPPPLKPLGLNNMVGAFEYIEPKTWYGPSHTLESIDARDDSYEAKRAALHALLEDGIVHLHHMPEERDALRRVFQRFGMLRRTFYAEDIWDLKVVADEDVNDTAMTNMELPPHTDCTYHAMPPGLQLFSCLENTAKGGESWFVDGRAIYETLRAEDPEAADFFTRTTLPFQCIEEGIYLWTTGTVFTLDNRGELLHFRYNNTDRAPLVNMSAEEVDDFYRHLPALIRTMTSDRLALLKRIEKNQLVVVDNHRCLHARKAFVGSRSFVGAYIDRDHFHSQCRLHGYELTQH